MFRVERVMGDLVIQWTGKRCPLAESYCMVLSALELMWPLAH